MTISLWPSVAEWKRIASCKNRVNFLEFQEWKKVTEYTYSCSYSFSSALTKNGGTHHDTDLLNCD